MKRQTFKPLFAALLVAMLAGSLVLAFQPWSPKQRMITLFQMNDSAPV
jgi:hypothetical protein